MKYIEKFNPVQKVWIKLTASLIIDKCQSRAVAHNEHIFIIGGQNKHRMEGSVERFNTKTYKI